MVIMVYFQILGKFNDFSPFFHTLFSLQNEIYGASLGNKDSESILSEDMEIKMQAGKRACFVLFLNIKGQQSATDSQKNMEGAQGKLGQLLYLVPQSQSAEDLGSGHEWRGEVQKKQT